MINETQNIQIDSLNNKIIYYENKSKEINKMLNQQRNFLKLIEEKNKYLN
jgi:hypothetical protein